MNDILQPPAERDLPAGRAERMQASVLAALQEPEPQHPGRRVAVLAAVVTTVAAGAVGAAWWPFGGNHQTLAMSAAELSPSLRDAAEHCLAWNQTRWTPTDADPRVQEVTLDNLAVATQHGDDSVMLFLNDAGYVTCELQAKRLGRGFTGSIGSDEWKGRRDWLPGPVEILGMSSSEFDGGDVTVTGRVSARVQRLVLEHGDRRTTTARLERGTFGLVSTGGAVHPDAQLVSYDEDGDELGRSPLYGTGEVGCYVDPAGKVVYQPRHAKNEPSPVDPAECVPAEPWGR
ncbi:hypothetical protein [Plantactinospora sp. KLBMP9567]|uniref:hypothetical protein n=1 Tax=Plantactinospora sp. KLBMP9567 TaxID=3085900 RepID=UPI002982915A|nr:hypothetical protein [Plantactinospora sp. KLBMP9567]MDW5323170.1 hypothetical protein [Plantactinospora sp. KLBMP9567]